MRSLIVISCGKAKVWDRDPDRRSVPARDAYTGSLFRLCRRYAESQAPEAWVILSAKYGLLRPNELIDDYDVTITDPDAISVDTLRKQWRKRFRKFERIISLCSRAYDRRLQAAVGSDLPFENPLAGQDLFKRMKWLRAKTVDAHC